MSKGDKEVLYMLVTKDEYELPIMVTNNASELAERCNISYGSLLTMLSKGKPGYRKVVIDGEY